MKELLEELARLTPKHGGDELDVFSVDYLQESQQWRVGWYFMDGGERTAGISFEDADLDKALRKAKDWTCALPANVA